MRELAPLCRVIPPPLPRWEVEWKVVELASEASLVDRTQVTAQSRLLEDLQLISLGLVEFIMTLEAQFPGGLSDKVCQEFFVGRSINLETITELVLHVWGTSPPDRSRWRRRKEAPSQADLLPFTQLDGFCDVQDWQAGQLFEPLGRNREGFRQFRRRTDGMRCIEIPGAEATIGSPWPDAPEDQRPLHQVELSSFLLDAEPVSNTAYVRFLNSVGRVPSSVLADWCGVGASDKRAAQYPLEVGFRQVWRARQGTEQQPMMLVSWYGANAYALWANRLDWRCYRGDGRPADELASRQVSAPPPPTASPRKRSGNMLPAGRRRAISRKTRRLPRRRAPGCIDRAIPIARRTFPRGPSTNGSA